MLEIREGLAAVDFARVHGWLTVTYWSPGIDRARVERAAAGSSLVVSAFRDDVQVGYLRVVSDRTSFACLADVVVDEDARGEGVASAMLTYALSHPDHQGLRRWVLATLDAHGVYERHGFRLIPNPERWMIRPGVLPWPPDAI